MKLRKSQRIMSLFLSLLMLLSTFAGSGFTVRAAEPTEVATEDVEATAATPTEVEGEDIAPDAYNADVSVAITTTADIKVLDASKTDFGLKPAWANLTEMAGVTRDSDLVYDDISVDSSNGYSFIIAPNTDAGKKLKDTVIDETKANSYYIDYTSLYYSSGWKKAADDAAATVNATNYGVTLDEVTVESTDPGYTVEDFEPVKGYKIVTLNSALLKDVIAKNNDSKGKWVGDGGGTNVAATFRPTLHITLAAADTGYVDINQPTAVGGITLAPINTDDLHKEWKTETSATVEIPGLRIVGSNENLDDATFTLKLSKDGAPIEETSFGTGTYKAETIAAKESTATADTNFDGTTAAKTIEYAKDTNKIKIYQGVINAAYVNGWTIDLEVDLTKKEEVKYAVSVADTTYAEVKKTASVDLPAETVEKTQIDVYAKGKLDGNGSPRQISKITYSVNGGVEKDVNSFSKTAATGSATGNIPAGDVTGPVVIKVQTSESVAVSTGTGYKVIDDKTGAIVTAGSVRVDTGSTYKFAIRTDAGYKVTKVSYAVNGETVNDNLTDTNGVYETAAITGALSISVTVANNVQTYDVKKTSASDTARGGATSLTVKDAITPANEINAAAGSAKATYMRPYYFTVTTSAASGKMIDKVTYTIGDGETVYDAIYVEGNTATTSGTAVTATYRTIPAITGDILIYASETDYITLKAGANAADITLMDGTTKVDGTGIKIKKNTAIQVKVTAKAADRPYTVTSVKAGTNEIAKAAGTVTVPASTTDVTLEVETEQAADNSTYSVEFKNQKANTKAGQLATDPLQSEFDSKGAVVPGSQKLTLKVGEKAELNTASGYTTLKITGSNNVVTEKNSGAGDTDVEFKLGITTPKSAVVADISGDDITGKKADGEDTITATFKVTDSTYANNKIVYTGTLPLKVVDRFSDIYIDGNDAVMVGDTTGTALTIKYKDGRNSDVETTLDAGSTALDTGDVVWSFDPPVTTQATLVYGYEDSGVKATKTITTSTATATVKATADATVGSKIKATATIYKNGSSTEVIKTLTKELNVIASAKYVAVPKVVVTNGLTYDWDAIKSDGTYQLGSTAKAINLAKAGNIQDAKVTVDVYEVLDGVAVTDEDSLAAQKKAGKVKAVDASKIKYTATMTYNSITGGNSAAPAAKRDTIYADLSGENGSYTVTAKKMTPVTTADTAWGVEKLVITPSVDGFAVDTFNIGFTVSEKIADQTVTFALTGLKYAEDGTYEDKDGKATTTVANAVKVANQLSENYLKGYERSVTYDFTSEYETGVKYTVENNGVITLPTEEDFAPATRDKRAILVGFIANDATKVGNAGGTAYTSGDVGFATGATVAVLGNVTFTAVWAPRYLLSTASTMDNTSPKSAGQASAAAALTNAGVETEVKDDEATAKAKEADASAADVKMKAYATALGAIARGKTIDVAIEAERAYGIKADGSVLTQKVYLTNGFELSYLDSDTKNKTNVTLGDTTVTGYAVAGTSSVADIYASFTDAKGATWKVKETNTVSVVDPTTYVVDFCNGTQTHKADNTAIADAYRVSKITLEESQAPTATTAVWPVAINGSGNLDLDTAKVEYSFSDKTVVESTADNTKKWKLGLTPKKVGTTTLTVKITDGSGNEATGTLPIEVIEDRVEIQLTNFAGTAVSSIEALGAYDNDSLTAEGQEDIGKVYAKAILKSDESEITGNGTFSVPAIATADQEIVTSGADQGDAGDGTNRHKITFSTASSVVLGTDSKNVYVQFAYTHANGTAVNYLKPISITTYYNLVLKGSQTYDSSSYQTSGSDYLFVLNNGVRQKDAKKTADEERDVPAETTTIKITKSDQTIERDTSDNITTNTFDIDLSKYSAELASGTTSAKITTGEFKFWFVDDTTGGGTADNFKVEGTEVKYDGTDPAKFKDGKILGLAQTSFANGVYTLTPSMGATTISSVVATPSSITLVNEKDKNYANVTLALTPSGTTDGVKVYAEDFGFFNWSATKQSSYTTTTIGSDSDSAADVATTGLTPTKGTGVEAGTATFAIGMVTDQAGKTNLKVYSSTDNTAKAKLLATIPLRIDGLKTEGSDTYYIEDGNKLKSTTKVINDYTYVFDEDGKQVKGDKVYDLNGKKVLIRNGVTAKAGVWTISGDSYVTNASGEILSGWQEYEGKKYYADPADDNILVDGLQTIDGKKYYFISHALATAPSTANTYAQAGSSTYYTNAAGEIASTGIFKVDGVDRLFDENGKIITYADTAEGVIEVGGVKYIVDSKAPYEAKRDDILYAVSVTWVDKFPAKWSKTDDIPTITYTITYTSANNGTKTTTDPIKADVSPATVGAAAESVTFTATANLAGYFVDKAGTKAAENESISKTYKFKDGGETGNSNVDISNGGGITIDGLEEEYLYTGAAIQPKFYVIDESRDDAILAKGVDYTVSFKNNKNVGKNTAEVIIKGKGNYQGQAATAKFSIVDPKADVDEADLTDLKAAKVKVVSVSPASFTYTGEPQFPETITLKVNGVDVAYTSASGDGSGYVDKDNNELPGIISFSGNVNKGTATMLITGRNDAKGKATTVKKTFKIGAVDLSAQASNLKIYVNGETEDAKAAWAVKGAQPDVEVFWTNPDGDEQYLVQGEDYTVKFTDNKKIVTTAGVTITGKGNFSKALKNAKTFEVEKFDLSEAEIIATTAADGIKANAVKVTVKDANGDLIPAGKLKVTVLGGESGDTDLSAAKTKLTAGNEITVKVEPTAKAVELTGEKTTDKITVGANFAKAKIVVTKGFYKTYTGEEVTLTDDEALKNLTVTLKVGKETKPLKYGEDFTIAGYTNNIKKGTMKVTLIGLEDDSTDAGVAVSGSKVVNVKIVAKPMTKAN